MDRDTTCRRCRRGLTGPLVPKSTVVNPRDRAKQSTWLYTLLIIALIIGGAYYLFEGFKQSYKQIQPNVSNLATPGNQQTPPLMRSEADQKRITPFNKAIQNAPGLVESNRHVEETQKLMESAK